MAIPRGTRRLLSLRKVAHKLGVTHEVAKFWWREGRLVGRVMGGLTRKRVTVPVEVVEYALRYHRLPTKLELHEAGVLSRAYLLELEGPDGGLGEIDPSDSLAGEILPSSSGSFSQGG